MISPVPRRDGGAVPTPQPGLIDPLQPDRYARHRAIEGFSQEELQGSRIAVIGAGAIGNEVIKNLCLLGVGTIDVYDFDTVELHNLTRSVLLRESDVGRRKASSVAGRAAELDPAVRLNAVEGDVWQTLRFADLARYRCVIGALDNFEARLRVNLLCWLAGVDWINAAIDSRYVSVESFPFGSFPFGAPPAEAGAEAGAAPSACYECGLPPSVYERIAERYSCGGLQRAAARQRIVPTTAITASFAGAQAVNQALRARAPGRRWLFDSHSGLATVAALTRADACPCCSDQPHAARLVPLAPGTAMRIDEAARDAGASSIRLSDPLIWECDCVNCGRTEATRAVELKRAGHVSAAITFCLQCRSEAIRVQIRDDFEPGELSSRYAPDAIVPARFAVVGATCLDLQSPQPMQRQEQPA
jgi:molybdopterin/thiamine biosynthesis adenylyltransferase